ncbi:hypothetical protein J2Z35_002525 [Acetoanaerobium pronyense]|uniref:Phage protein n=1 Tax=Acetoanaerobium pronyense TaxID=1482736 RepID=A0ABS4KMY3_9FIRM|nr:hypothetical protein [Acetoanaerobium pronyense]MBP2028695.1 hypothetical protein [Acetoanaerobium pronyense]
MINNLVLETLKPLSVPVGFQKYSGKEIPYITFHEYLSTGEQFDDDEEAMTGHYIQVDVWSKGDYGILVKNIKIRLLEAGFKRVDEADFYETDTELYHKGLRFFYLEEQEDVNV